MFCRYICKQVQAPCCPALGQVFLQQEEPEMQVMRAAQADLLLQTKYESWDQFAQPSLVRGGEGEDEMNKSRNRKAQGFARIVILKAQ